MRRDPVIAAVAAAGAALIGWMLLADAGPAAQVRLFWTALPVFDVLLWYLCRRIARLRMPVDARRFWRRAGHTAIVFIVGDASQTVVAWLHPGAGAAVPHPVQATAILAGVSLMVWTMLTHPSRLLSRPARVRFWLDAASVLVGAAVLVWLLLLPRDSDSGRPGGAAVALLLGTAVILVAAFSAVKLMLSGNSPVSARAAVPMVAAGVTQGLAGALVGPDGHYLPVLLATQLLTPVLLATGLRLQELGGPPAPSSRRAARPYSLLPYTALAGMFAALPVVLRDGGGPDLWVVLGGLFVATVLAVSRQLLAFAENAALMQELRGQEERIRSLLAHSTDITSLVDADGVLTYVSPATERLLGKAPDALLGTPVHDHVHPEDLAVLRPAMRQVRGRPGATVSYQVRYAHADGSWRWLDVVTRNLLHVPAVRAYVSNARDATQARLLQDELRHQATHDGLTGLANRALFDARLSALSVPAAVLLVDLNGFKAVNDTYGHHVGDAVLAGVADRLAAATTPGGTAARLGGDEFAVLLPGADAAAAAGVAERFLALLAAPMLVDGHHLPVRATVGIADGPPGDPDALLRRADTEMYRNKPASDAFPGRAQSYVREGIG
ncbi:diguanylate cyclase domain-containing protein [Dactylosporangium sp. CA-092794]|uniref:diguanylate cyclase domain-containing protein n=1 Tax=Dactylosporangium sp. CA-092794 TaxID=3239929 RepID=UPI003D8F9E55